MQPPRFEFYDPHSPIYTSPRFLPPAKIVKCKVSDAIVSHGAYLEDCVVENAIIGLRSRIGKGVTIRVSCLPPVTKGNIPLLPHAKALGWQWALRSCRSLVASRPVQFRA